MLRHPTIETLQTLKLTGMATALAEQLEMPAVQSLSFEARLGLLVDRERTTQENRRLAKARFRLPAALEDLDARAPPRAGHRADRLAGHGPVDPHP